MDAIWFVVERGAGGKEIPTVIVDQLPAHLVRKIAKDVSGTPLEKPPIIYSLRLDQLPAQERARWIDEDGKPVVSVSRMYRAYCLLRDRGELPTATAGKPERPPDPIPVTVVD